MTSVPPRTLSSTLSGAFRSGIILFQFLVVLSALGGDPIPGIPESANYDLIYSLTIPNTANFNASGTAYDIDNHADYPHGFTRIAYYLELGSAGQAPTWVWVSMDAFTDNLGKIGVPDATTGAMFAQNVKNMNVFCSGTSVTTGTGLQGGNIEFWPSNYDRYNVLDVPNGSEALFDWGDEPSAPWAGYGSMQIHNHEAQQVLLAYNAWGTGGNGDVGIGNNLSTGQGNPDWTFSGTVVNYTVKNLRVYVLPTPEKIRVTSHFPAADRNGIYLRFNGPLEKASAQNPANYTISPSLKVNYATQNPQAPGTVYLGTDLQAQNQNYTIQFSNLKSGNFTSSPGYSLTFKAAEPQHSLGAKASEAGNFIAIHELTLPKFANFNFVPVFYETDRRDLLFGGFSRIAYYLELTRRGGLVTDWIFVSMDAFTDDPSLISIPHAPKPIQAMPVYNMNIYSSVAELARQNVQQGGIEFWSNDYGGDNPRSVPNADPNLTDWGDNPNGGVPTGFGSMEVDDFDAKHVLFAYNGWGNRQLHAGIGIGNNPAGETDYTFSGTIHTYEKRRLVILAIPLAPLPPPPPPAPPTLMISTVDSKIAVSWSEGAGAVVLEANRDLNEPTGWFDYGVVPEPDGLGFMQVLVDPQDAPLFFRLRAVE